ncbi:unnamed protein product, partial [Musa acuminata var. zebrina]
MHVRRRVLDGVANAGLGRQVHHVGEGHDVEELGEEASVIDVPLHHEHAAGVQQRHAGLLQRGVVVAIEVVEADHAVAALAEGEGDVGADEPSSTGDKHGEAAGAADGGGGPDLLLPLHPAPRRVKVPGRGVDEALEAEVGSRERDQEQRPQEHGTGGREALVELTIDRVRPLDLHLPGRGRKQLVFHRPHHLFLHRLRCLPVDRTKRWRRRQSSECKLGVRGNAEREANA